MINGLTIQLKVSSYEEGFNWYKMLLNREPDFVPHEHFAEWELVKGAWLQIAKGEPDKQGGPLRLGVHDIYEERGRLMRELDIEIEEVQTREGVPAAWCTFEDPFGNRIGLYQELGE
ncbi:VOC family protein [Alkalihalobacillus sp. FSL R5-0424]